jgi:radical SAM modification target selenobiotic family peptide
MEVTMDKKELKKLLAGVGIAGLLAGVGGVAIGGSG